MLTLARCLSNLLESVARVGLHPHQNAVAIFEHGVILFGLEVLYLRPLQRYEAAVNEATPAPDLKQTAKPKPDPLAGARARFRQARLLSRRTLADTADAAGVSLQAISQFERGLNGLQLASFVAACDAMRLRVEWVLKGTGETFDGEMVAGISRHKRKVNRRPTNAGTPGSARGGP